MRRIDKKKYKNILNPLVDDLSRRFKYGTDGFMETLENNDAIAGNTITMFNLNNQTLKERRKNIMTAARNMFEGGMDKEEILRIMASDGFISAVEYELSML